MKILPSFILAAMIGLTGTFGCGSDSVSTMGFVDSLVAQFNPKPPVNPEPPKTGDAGSRFTEPSEQTQSEYLDALSAIDKKQA